MTQQSRNTKQKDLIAQAINMQSAFFNTNDVVQYVQTQDPSIGVATIYRYLADSRKKGSLHSYTCDGQKLYSKEKRNHCHFICEKCGSTEHLDIKNLSYLKGEVQGKICHVQVDITGVCANCTHD